MHTVKHNYITSIITMGVLKRHVSALHVGHLQVVIRLDQLYYNAWRILGEQGVWEVPWSGSQVELSLVACPAHFINMLMGTALMC